MNKTKRLQRGSLKHATEIMTEEEADLFIRAAAENQVNELQDDLTEQKAQSIIEEARKDMKMIDSILHMKRLHLAVNPYIKRTATGGLRKGSTLYNALESIIDARAKDKI